MQMVTAPRWTRRSIVVFAVTSLASAGLLVLMAVRLVAAGNAVSSAPTSPLIGHKAPGFSIVTWMGAQPTTVRLAAFKGHPVVVNFWGSWCEPCQEEQPILNAAWQKYRSSGIQFIGIAYHDQQTAGAAFLRQQGVSYPAGAATADTVSTDYAVTGAPETVFIGRNGIVIDKFIGPIDDGTLDQKIRGLLAS
jgi:cytochrome c biogenesis protein CcmG, thiol:disulfide interchange protein DsbE